MIYEHLFALACVFAWLFTGAFGMLCGNIVQNEKSEPVHLWGTLFGPVTFLVLMVTCVYDSIELNRHK